MDPQATWDMLLRAWSRREWSEVFELCEALLGWLDKRGFPPETNYPNELGADWNGVIAKAACEFALRRSRQVLDDPNGIPADVPFVLICAKCLHEGPVSFAAAEKQGWVNIQYVPAGASENFLGLCSRCRNRD